jgi:hypothetical protein
MSKIGRYWKFVTAATGVTATACVALGVHDTAATVLIAVASALGVLAVPNKTAPRPPARM